jgi:hypothetical protein
MTVGQNVRVQGVAAVQLALQGAVVVSQPPGGVRGEPENVLGIFILQITDLAHQDASALPPGIAGLIWPGAAGLVWPGAVLALDPERRLLEHVVNGGRAEQAERQQRVDERGANDQQVRRGAQKVPEADRPALVRRHWRLRPSLPQRTTT